jgi:hypothetical protein
MTLDDLKRNGFNFEKHSTCNDCGEAIEWWTDPDRKWKAYNPMNRGSDQVRIHRITCTCFVPSKERR